mmetsp:Transcript_15860/g.28666  ORF Transcript_15860/g.28666 Transcript_15860/m.28666 type:complete len:200 (-) Transcript_15860:527-1126(-)
MLIMPKELRLVLPQPTLTLYTCEFSVRSTESSRVSKETHMALMRISRVVSASGSVAVGMSTRQASRHVAFASSVCRPAYTTSLPGLNTALSGVGTKLMRPGVLAQGDGDGGLSVFAAKFWCTPLAPPLAPASGHSLKPSSVPPLRAPCTAPSAAPFVPLLTGSGQQPHEPTSAIEHTPQNGMVADDDSADLGANGLGGE